MSGARSPVALPTWRRADGVLWRRLSDGAIFLPPGADDPVKTSLSGEAIWSALEVPSTVDELVATLAEAFSADPADVAADVAATLEVYRELGIVEVGGQGDQGCGPG